MFQTFTLMSGFHGANPPNPKFVEKFGGDFCRTSSVTLKWSASEDLVSDAKTGMDRRVETTTRSRIFIGSAEREVFAHNNVVI